MIIYIIKAICCSAFLLLVYQIFLEKEKMHRFNRFYLLFAIVFSFAVPLISFQKAVPEAFFSQYITFDNAISPTQKDQLQVLPSQSAINFGGLIAGIYCSVSLVLLFRFAKNLIQLYSKIKAAQLIEFEDSRLVLTNDLHAPFSFLNYVFINRMAYEERGIESEVLQHELAHVSQKHTLDILLIEFLLVVGWVNPILFLYRKAIQLNHEFLADESVVTNFDAHQYQLLLLTKTCGESAMSFSSAFNYSFTKKRLLMITRTTSIPVAIVKMIALIPVFALSLVLFSEETAAQTVEIQRPNRPIVSAGSGQASLDLIKEYHDIIDKYKRAGKGWRGRFQKDVTDSDRDRLEKIFRQMSDEQQLQQEIVLVAWLPPAQKNSPTIAQLDSWQDEKMYGVWIDGKRIENFELKNYSASDFGLWQSSALMKNATNYGKHYFQIDLLTQEYYKRYYESSMADQRASFAFVER